jgi:hypothetical protein
VLVPVAITACPAPPGYRHKVDDNYTMQWPGSTPRPGRAKTQQSQPVRTPHTHTHEISKGRRTFLGLPRNRWSLCRCRTTRDRRRATPKRARVRGLTRARVCLLCEVPPGPGGAPLHLAPLGVHHQAAALQGQQALLLAGCVWAYVIMGSRGQMAVADQSD